MLEELKRFVWNLDDRGMRTTWPSPTLTRSRWMIAAERFRASWCCTSIRIATLSLAIGCLLTITAFIPLLVHQPLSQPIGGRNGIPFELVLMVAAILLMGFTTAVMLVWVWTGGVRKSLVIYHLSKSQCPACWSTMQSAPIEEDGCAVCLDPECGAAWKISHQISQP